MNCHGNVELPGNLQTCNVLRATPHDAFKRLGTERPQEVNVMHRLIYEKDPLFFKMVDKGQDRQRAASQVEMEECCYWVKLGGWGARGILSGRSLLLR